MTANVTASILGGGASIGGGASGISDGLMAGVYTLDYVAGDVLVFTDFSELKYVDINLEGTRPSTIKIDAVTANLVNIPLSSTGGVTAYAVGIKA